MWDAVDGRYEPATITDATAADVPVTPSGTLAATNVQAALVELDTEKATTVHTHAAQGVVVRDEGVGSTSATTFDFVGAGVTSTVSSGVATVTIPGGGAGAAPDTGVRLSGPYLGSLHNPAGAFGSLTTAAFFGPVYTYWPVVVTGNPTADAVLMEVTTAAAAGAQARCAIYTTGGVLAPVALVAHTNSVPVDSTGIKTATFVTPLALTPGRYIMALQMSASSATMRAFFISTYASASLGVNGLVTQYRTVTGQAYDASPASAPPAPTDLPLGSGASPCPLFFRFTF